MNYCPTCGSPCGGGGCFTCFTGTITGGQPKLPDEEVLYAEPLVGWRCWWNQGDKLVSGNPLTTWEPKTPLRAVHHVRSGSTKTPCADAPCDDYSPRVHYGCGIYAYKNERDLEQRFHSECFYTSVVIGEVYLWGRIYEHERGYRAQYAYPKRIVYSHPLSLEQISHAYNVPVEEDPAWKSVFRNGAYFQNLSSYLNLSAPPAIPNPPMYIPWSLPPNQYQLAFPPTPPPSQTPNPLTSSSLQQAWRQLLGGKP